MQRNEEGKVGYRVHSMIGGAAGTYEIVNTDHNLSFNNNNNILS